MMTIFFLFFIFFNRAQEKLDCWVYDSDTTHMMLLRSLLSSHPSESY